MQGETTTEPYIQIVAGYGCAVKALSKFSPIYEIIFYNTLFIGHSGVHYGEQVQESADGI